MSQMCDVMENDVIDVYLRNQASGKPTTWNLGLYTAAPGETGGGTKATYTNYADVAIVASLADMSGTQSAGSTTASSGTGGQSSNNNALTWGTAAGSGRRRSRTSRGRMAPRRGCTARSPPRAPSTTGMPRPRRRRASSP